MSNVPTQPPATATPDTRGAPGSAGSSGVRFTGKIPVDEDKLVYCFLFTAYAIGVFWGLASPSAWDDDVPNRYFNALRAFDDPSHFVDLFSRPLWIMLFAGPAQLGPFVIPVIMMAIAVCTAYFLYRAVQLTGRTYAFMVVPFLLFQPYFFGVARDAETEPLAACLFAVGYFLLLRKQWTAFALVGAILPLARLELVVCLIFWAVPLARAGRAGLIPVLALGLAGHNLAGMVIDATLDPLWLLHQVLDRGAGVENPYGHGTATVYLGRFFYVIGPIVFFFFVAGCVERVIRKDLDGFVIGQLVLGFVLYTVFAWKLNVGRSAGFLRNLIPLSPFFALLAQAGFSYAMEAVNTRKRKLRMVGTGVLALGLTHAFFSNRIVLHHVVVPRTDPLNLPLALVVAGLLGALFMIYSRSKPLRDMDGFLFALQMTLLVVGHTLFTEPPDANMNGERDAMGRLSDFYDAAGLDRYETYTYHPWFLWVGRRDPRDHQFTPLSPEILAQAPDSALVIWDSHYGVPKHRGVELGHFAASGDYLELAREVDPNGIFVSVVFQKLPDPRAPGVRALFERYGSSGYVPLEIAQGRALLDLGRPQESLDVFDGVVERNPDHPFAVLGRALARLELDRVAEGCEDLNRAYRLGAEEAILVFQSFCMTTPAEETTEP